MTAEQETRESRLASATMHYRAGRLAEAERECEEALARHPEHAAMLNLLAIVLASSGRAERAIEIFRRALALDASNANYHANLAAALRRLRRDEEALASCDAAVALQPDHAPALNNRATALQALGRDAEALVSCDRAIALNPEFAEAHGTRAVILQSMGRLQEADASYERALALAPNLVEVRMLQAILLLARGDYARGFEAYEARWQWEYLLDPRRPFAQPLWLGKEELHGKTILLYAEQGMGDTLQFIRYAPLVAAKGARVILEVHPPLAALAARVEGIAQVLPRGTPLPPFDFRCPLLSLPHAFGTRLETVPADVPYLTPSAESVSKWRARLGEAAGLRVGIAWSGSTGYQNDAHRSLRLRQLLFLQEMGAELFSLQKDMRPEDAEALERNGKVRHFGAGFEDTAALISLMDLVISVDTSIGHLAGAMGRPYWLLLSHPCDWRWMLAREDSPWYPTARLFRQSKAGDWDGVLAGVRRALKPELARAAARTEVRRVASEAEQAIGAGDYVGAEKLLSRGAAADSPSGRVQHLLAVALHEQGKLDRAIACYRKAVKDDSLQPGLHRDLAAALAERRQYADALSSYREALRQHPSDEKACIGAASACRALGDVAQARQYFQRALRLRLMGWLRSPMRALSRMF